MTYREKWWEGSVQTLINTRSNVTKLNSLVGIVAGISECTRSSSKGSSFLLSLYHCLDIIKPIDDSYAAAKIPIKFCWQKIGTSQNLLAKICLGRNLSKFCHVPLKIRHVLVEKTPTGVPVRISSLIVSVRQDVLNKGCWEATTQHNVLLCS